ncbi:MarR family winged helix-turn-helix transcriptional regulator [Lactiplantibacillus modestisalitolerans]|uniref:MarR family winged helix-turn-helix transcriptional regulator n=1 Tax=Lactiplantibacillus modestisalitolerans TaxID=1457219 RepID=A0ABV5WT96_9LACO|nr:helix-turn-helix domain-containing protein [Lactiplantibacillus modestisalitolerans]
MKNSLGIAIQKANNALARDRDQFAKTLGLTGRQVSAINFIADHENERDLFQRDLEHEFNIRKATASSLVTAMVAKNLLIRVPSTTDARYKRLLLTPHARQMAQQIAAFFATSERRMQTLLADQFSLSIQSLQQISQAFTATPTMQHSKKP